MAYGFNNREYVDESSIQIVQQLFCFDFCCPLCNTLQTATLTIEELVLGTTLHCVHHERCKRENFRMDFVGFPIMVPAEDPKDNEVAMAITDDFGGSLELRLPSGDTHSTPLQDIDWGRGFCQERKTFKLRLAETPAQVTA